MMPKHRKARFDALSDRRQTTLSSSGILFGDQQTVVFFPQFRLQSLAPITEIADHDSVAEKFGQAFSDGSVGVIAGRQHDIANLFFSRRQDMQFEAEKPALRRFTEIRAVVSEQSDSAVPRGVTQRNRFGIDQKRFARVKGRRLRKQFFNDSRQPMQPADKLFVAAKLRKFRCEVLGNETESLTQAFDCKFRLQQRDRQNFRIRDTWASIVAAPPLGNFSMGLQKIIDKAVDFGQFIKYLVHWLSFRANRFSWSIIYFTSLYGDNHFFSNSDWS
jgi:hypothetical protein